MDAKMVYIAKSIAVLFVGVMVGNMLLGMPIGDMEGAGFMGILAADLLIGGGCFAATNAVFTIMDERFGQKDEDALVLLRWTGMEFAVIAAVITFAELLVE